MYFGQIVTAYGKPTHSANTFENATEAQDTALEGIWENTSG